jgi:drug/metabolite transporter (DMT)-like permease
MVDGAGEPDHAKSASRPADTSLSAGRAGANHLLGVVLIVASTGFFALAGIFTKAATTADPLTIACWRGFVGSLIIGAYVHVRRDRARPATSFSLGWRGWALAVVGALSSIAFIAAFKYTYVANVAVIYATVPFMAAAIEWLALGVRTRMQTMATAAVSLIGVVVIMVGSFGGGSLFGDGLAVVMTFGCAVYLVMVRAYRGTPVVWAAAVSSALLFLGGWMVGDPLAISGLDFALIASFGLSFSAASVLWTEGARFLPASESGLLGATEVPLAILFAWLILNELPPAQSVVGGAIVLVAVFAHAVRDFIMSRRESRNGQATASPLQTRQPATDAR